MMRHDETNLLGNNDYKMLKHFATRRGSVRLDIQRNTANSYWFLLQSNDELIT